MRLFSIIAFFLFSICTIFAQSLEGVWTLDAEGKSLMELDKEEDDDTSLDFLLVIPDKETMNVGFLANVVEEEVGTIVILLKTPGSYTLKNQTVNAEFRTEETDISLLNIDTEDPDIKGMVSTKEGLKLFETLIKQGVADNMKEVKKGLGELSELFKQFTIKSLSESELAITLQVNEEKVEFHFNKANELAKE